MSIEKPPSRGTVERNDLVAYLDSYLMAGEGSDFCPNGLQVEGNATIQRLVTGVSACWELFERARGRRHQRLPP